MGSNRTSIKVKCSTSLLSLIEKRKLGLRKCMLDDLIAFKLYNNLNEFQLRDPEFESNLGGIGDMGFSTDGKLLAACQGWKLLLFDAANQKLINTVENLHRGCLNRVRFLNDKQFATCSRDSSIKIWDVRKVQSCITTLQGRSNWVSDIEWLEEYDIMVASALDGSVYAWDLKTHKEYNFMYDEIFQMKGLSRMKLTDGGRKMVISSHGFLMIIHNLNFLTMAIDLWSFREIGDQRFSLATIYDSLLSTRRRNRIEIIGHFPNVPECITSLQIHPHGWSAVSRNRDDKYGEWTCVHDIQTRYPEVYYENAFTSSDEDSDGEVINSRVNEMSQPLLENLQLAAMRILNTGLVGVNSSFSAYFRQLPEQPKEIVRNPTRLTHFIKEKNVGKGYTKELCFSSDGRVICSPYDRGVRLLGFNDRCQELSVCVPDNPQQLRTIVEMNNYHRDVVVSCKFSPVHYQLVTGCLGSEIKWYQPIL